MALAGPTVITAARLDGPSYSQAVILTSDHDLTANGANGFTSGCARELYVGTGGTVVAQLQGDSAPQTYKNVPSGTTLSGFFTLVKSTANGTTAADIVARY